MIPLSLDDDRRLVAEYIGQNNTVRCPAETWIESKRTSRGKSFSRGDAEFAEKSLMKCFGLEPRLIGFDLTLCPPRLRERIYFPYCFFRLIVP
jgi:hypothetical protein